MSQTVFTSSRFGLLSLTFVSFMASLGLGCSSDDSSSQATSGQTSGSASGSQSGASPVSFASDVLPVLQSSCGMGSIACHGDPQVTTITPSRPYFASSNGSVAPASTLATSMRAGLVNVAASEAPSLVLVKPGDAANSYLQAKIDNNLAGLAAQCAKGTFDGTCGQSMPIGVLLPQTTRDLIRAWINQGALNN